MKQLNILGGVDETIVIEEQTVTLKRDINRITYWVMPACLNLNAEKHLKISTLIDSVCFMYGTSRKELKSNRRFRNLVVPRQIIFYILHKKFGYGSKETGKVLNRDHSTVIYACGVIKDLMSIDNDFKNKVNSLI